ncbi:sigma-54-dependent transcriptional regulator [Ereboglobus luteus]|uniref:Sigma-54 factor interaction domain-containing protein n=1 Tax=Ereboglobus luteus TaxID=1796921 RepID=A0A2U8E0X9_9BACT|nr:sigma 54-interacting transcriptional regulator [Ereboglobus luteus]AWI08517.1 hypothetical protein CKA38_03955 [Ereboglobus luteus]
MKRLFSPDELHFAQAVGRISASNHFLPERVELEREALGSAFTESGAAWNEHISDDNALTHPNIVALLKRSETLAENIRARWPKDGRGITREEMVAYINVASFWLYHAYALQFDALIQESEERRHAAARKQETSRAETAPDNKLTIRPNFYGAFRNTLEHLLRLPGIAILDEEPAPHLFAYAFQLRRAFHYIHRALAGGSRPMVRLRAQIWESIFTRDIGRYRRALYSRMHDYATLITGPSGTGKELVARAIGLSRYIPFDARRGEFADDYTGAFFPLNLSALSPTLIESELFGHRRGAFTGALADRAGWLEICPANGAVFLDEIGDVDTAIQVKLLRTLQSRAFQRLGDTDTRTFQGKIIAATHRDLPAEIRGGRFREDFYYRLCSDVVRTPSLREQLDDAPTELETLAAHIARQLLGDGEAPAFARESVAWIRKRLGAAYAWPGNFRELEQCMRNLLVRGEYHPASLHASGGDTGDWNALLANGSLTAEDLLRRYTRQVHAQSGRNIEETARRLDVDRRTVKARL